MARTVEMIYPVRFDMHVYKNFLVACIVVTDNTVTPSTILEKFQPSVEIYESYAAAKTNGYCDSPQASNRYLHILGKINLTVPNFTYRRIKRLLLVSFTQLRMSIFCAIMALHIRDTV